MRGVRLQEASRERFKAYFFLLVFVAAAVLYGYIADAPLREVTVSPMPAMPLVIGAVLISLATIAPMVITFRPSAVGNMIATMREKARRSDKTVTLTSASRTASLYVAALAGTPMLYGVMLQFMVGEFRLLLGMLPFVAILAAVGWVVLDGFFTELQNHFTPMAAPKPPPPQEYSPWPPKKGD